MYDVKLTISRSGSGDVPFSVRRVFYIYTRNSIASAEKKTLDPAQN